MAPPSTYLAAIVTVIVYCVTVTAFNLSPKPNYVFREPSLHTYQEKSRSSYFGYSVNLRLSSVLVGAPRAQSTLETQQNINETGAIYRCTFAPTICSLYNYDELGNIETQDTGGQLTREKKDHQWLGMVMDGSSSDDDRFVVCAPRVIRDLSNDNLLHGLCYWSANTSDSSPLGVQKIAPFREKGKQTFPGDLFYYTFGELGLSVHVTEDDTVLIGAPGVFNWKGTIVRFQSKSQDGSGGLSRRDVSEKSVVRKRDAMYYETDVPNPGYWTQSNDSYFGYAVSSGYFEGTHSNHILYVGSAPQANGQRGEVYIFDIVPVGAPVFSTEKTIKIFYTFSSQQMGEYYGYALVSEDFNGDNFYDIAIAAPFNAKKDSYENGAVYIYENQGLTATGKWSGGFVHKSTLTSEIKTGGGRFGLALSKIGDINQDGFNDLAVGAPYENDGAVYIFLGGPDGLSSKPSQIIYAPSPSEGAILPQTFGQSLSKGADVDGNLYLDLAVGAPNAEVVYVYRSYPVVKVVANVIPLTKELKVTDSSFKFKVCWSLESKFELQNETGIILQLKLDPDSIYRRATFVANGNNVLEVNTTANAIESCLEYDASVKYSLEDVYKPIDIEMHYQILNLVPQSTDVFCDYCLAVNPQDPKSASNKIVFNVGCASERCVADLKLSSTVVEPIPYIIGSSNSLSIEYRIENAGETAYLTQIRITIFDGITFKKTPASCTSQANTKELLCNINNGSPLFRGDEGKLTIDLDTTKLELVDFIVKAYVFSTGDELNETDNYVDNIIPLAEFSEIEAIGQSSLPVIILQDGIRNETITHIFEIRNNGPSNLNQIEILLSIPVALIDKWTLEPVYIIEVKNITVKSNYNNQKVDVEWLETNLPLQIVENNVEVNVFPPIVAVPDNMNGNNYDTSRVGMEYDLSGAVWTEDEFFKEEYRRRRRRSLNVKPLRRFNRYTQSVTELHQQDAKSRSRRSMTFKNDNTLTMISLNRATIFDCYDDSEAICVDAKLVVNNFVSGNKAIQLNVKFDLDLTVFNNIVTDSKDIFVIKPSVDIRKTGDENGNDINVIQTHPYTIIYKYRLFSTPIWVYIVSVLGGLLLLTLLTYGMYRLGFFKRAKKEEMEQATLSSQRKPLAEQTSDNEEN
ncbi:Integrin alpha-PS3 [Pseudolycoriella hygida]|uniref:Integrin alpha-PS3 n=1 Tax=Pseudolycoriella hygida TaxID=35572 RepID=A0A9Q0N1I9_9DIPT|nr:Integrin alpha-PS3 [Pseudolycoriella hygida]